ncbi:hypothetical protein BN2475_140015 [Paraburkholderia ribeironis]|uniref:Uncharacterized protein n=1 Tax=Paraburkholderia ribeironis TaxID=1247936 RepID=A0A1N7RSL3_9BURK|nr:hypothetical protein BN2475_140015 [Paraburkholderia ribeironis]
MYSMGVASAAPVTVFFEKSRRSNCKAPISAGNDRSLVIPGSQAWALKVAQSTGRLPSTSAAATDNERWQKTTRTAEPRTFFFMTASPRTGAPLRVSTEPCTRDQPCMPSRRG